MQLPTVTQTARKATAKRMHAMANAREEKRIVDDCIQRKAELLRAAAANGEGNTPAAARLAALRVRVVARSAARTE